MATPDRPPSRRQLKSEDEHITFPIPLSSLPEQPPSDIPRPPDIIIDPYGNLYCFVCSVNIPRGATNISQHVRGKKHENQDRRFTSAIEKERIRDRYIRAADEQRATVDRSVHRSGTVRPPHASAMSATVPNRPSTSARRLAAASAPQSSGAPKPSPAPLDPRQESHAPSDPAAPRSPRSIARLEKAQKRREDKEKLARELRESVSLDKKQYMEEVLKQIQVDSDDEATKPDKVIEDGGKLPKMENVVDNDNDDDSHTLMRNYEDRRHSKTFEYKAPEGPDLTFETMAAETPPSEVATRLRETFASAANNPKESPTKRVTTIAQFIPLPSTERQRELDRQQKKKAEESRQGSIILLDDNGDELPPWLLDRGPAENVLYTADSSIALHFEILQFMRFMSPTQAEIQARTEMIMTVESITSKLWPGCTANVFGSYATGLALPSSDIDICVLNTPAGGTPEEFDALAEAVRNVTGFAKRVQVVKSAKVPLVKIISRKTSMNCDISIAVDNGLKNVPRIKQFIEKYPALRPLLLVIKCFMHQRSLNEVYMGGLGSYTLLLMVVSHLQMITYNFPKSKANLGAQLQQFFQLYGSTFNPCLTGMQVRENGRYFDKFARYHTMPRETARFCVEDPNDVTNELGKNGFAVMQMRRAFFHASRTLIRWRRDDANYAPTPLGAIVNVELEYVQRRRTVIEDLERQGDKPLRFSISERAPMNTGSGGTARGEAGGGSSNAVGDVAPRRSASPERRRDRDPRLGKRRRGSMGEEERRASGSRSFSFNGGERAAGRANDGAGRDGGSYGNGQGVDVPYAGVPDGVNGAPYGGVPVGGVPASGSAYPHQAATPGYSYAGMPVYVNNDVPMPPAFPMQAFGGLMPVQGVPVDGEVVDDVGNGGGTIDVDGWGGRGGGDGRSGRDERRAGSRGNGRIRRGRAAF